MRRGRTVGIAAAAVLTAAWPSFAQMTAGATAAPSHRPTGRVSITVDTSEWRDAASRARRSEIVTAANLATPDVDEPGVEFGVSVRHAGRNGGDDQRMSIYEGFAGARFGSYGQVRIRGGHMWLPDLGTVGALAGGLIEIQQPRILADDTRVRAGVFAGREPRVYEVGYAPDVRKMGGYFVVEQGFLRRHVVGYTRVQQADLTERSVLTVTNFVPGGQRLFVYQAAEFDVSGPADGTAPRGLSYFLANGRLTAGPRVELSGTYNRGRSIDARTLTDDVRNGRAVTPERAAGYLYETGGGRVTVEVARNVRLYAGYARDRYNRGEAPQGRVTIGGHAGNLFGSGIDVSGSNTRVERGGTAYQSRYVSVGRSVGRAVYASVDYATSLSVVRFVRSDGIVVETRPWMRRVSGSGSILLGRRLSLLLTCDYETDETSRQIRMLAGLSARL